MSTHSELWIGMVSLGIIVSVTLMYLAGIWIPTLLLRRALAKPFPAHYSKILRKNIPVYSRMPAHLQMQLKRMIKQFLAQKKFIGCNGFEITDEVKVTIAAKAGMLLLNRPKNRAHLVYPDLKMVLVYPSVFMVPRIETGASGLVTHKNQTLSGESWSDGRVIFAWDHVLKKTMELPDGHDVVLHEFAHQLDSETGVTNGAPRLANKIQYQNWSAVMSREFENLINAEAEQRYSVLDYYGATSPAEFFAVATETFFEKTNELAYFHPELFEQLRAYYQVDPRDWN